MSYVNAEDVLPKILVEEIQKYVDGQLIYGLVQRRIILISMNGRFRKK